MLQSPLLAHQAGYIDGIWQDQAASGKHFAVYNPATGARLARLPLFGYSETTQAIMAAARAFQVARYSESLRVSWLLDIQAALLQHQRELGRIICMEHGKPIDEAIGEVKYAASFFQTAARDIVHLRPRCLPDQPKGMDWLVYCRPIGVAGLIVPWNFPIAMIAKKLSAALAAGAPTVIKPAEDTPLTMVALFNILDRQVDLPRGMVNLVMGDPQQIGKAFMATEDVAMVSFTGSTEVGKLLMSQASGTVKRLGFELGGNAPFVVMPDANIEQAITELIANKFRASGQTCVCANRVLVHQDIVKEFTERLAKQVRQLQVGNGLHAGTDIGPLINRQGYDKVLRHVSNALELGAELVVGELPVVLARRKDLFFPPTLLSNVSLRSCCASEETFGPLIPIIPFGDGDDIISLCNRTPYGLAAYLFTSDMEWAETALAQLQFGHIGLNTGTGPTPEAPFGGMKLSGIGREGGPEGLMEYVEVQTVPRGRV